MSHTVARKYPSPNSGLGAQPSAESPKSYKDFYDEAYKKCILKLGHSSEYETADWNKMVSDCKDLANTVALSKMKDLERPGGSRSKKKSRTKRSPSPSTTTTADLEQIKARAKINNENYRRAYKAAYIKCSADNKGSNYCHREADAAAMASIGRPVVGRGGSRKKKRSYKKKTARRSRKMMGGLTVAEINKLESDANKIKKKYLMKN